MSHTYFFCENLVVRPKNNLLPDPFHNNFPSSISFVVLFKEHISNLKNFFHGHPQRITLLCYNKLTILFLQTHLCCSNSCLSFSSSSFNFFSRISFCPSCFALRVIAYKQKYFSYALYKYYPTLY